MSARDETAPMQASEMRGAGAAKANVDPSSPVPARPVAPSRSVPARRSKSRRPAEIRIAPSLDLGSPLPGSNDRLYLVRHANAGRRSAWTEDDELRPLSRSGRRQAEGIVHLFARLDVATVVSSPYVRCWQTVRPLALSRAIPLEIADTLAEGSATADALALLAASPGGSVLCSHGDVIPAIIEALRADGMRVDGEEGWKKGSIWVLERSGGRLVDARYVPPPRYA